MAHDSAGLDVVPNFRPVMEITSGASGRRCTWSACSTSHADGLNSPAGQAFAQRWGRESGDTDHAARRPSGFGCPNSHSRERRPHLAAHAQHDDVAGQPSHGLDHPRCRFAQQALELLDRLRCRRIDPVHGGAFPFWTFHWAVRCSVPSRRPFDCPFPQNLEAKTMPSDDVGIDEFCGRGDE